MLTGELITLKSFLSKTRASAIKRGLEFDLTLDQFQSLVYSNCYLCGVEPTSIKNHNSANAKPIKTNGIDRLDPKLGYVIDNVRPCCWKCNRAKSNLSFNAYVAHVGKTWLFLMEKLKNEI